MSGRYAHPQSADAVRGRHAARHDHDLRRAFDGWSVDELRAVADAYRHGRSKHSPEFGAGYASVLDIIADVRELGQ